MHKIFVLHSLWYHHTYRCDDRLCKTKILCIKLVNYRDKYTEMHGQQNVKTIYLVMPKIINSIP